MKVIHGGTVINTVFHVVDDEGNVVKTLNVGPNQQQEQDPLRISVLVPSNFQGGYEALNTLKKQLQEQLDEQGEVSVEAPETEVVEATSE